MGYVLRLWRTNIDDQNSNAIIPASPLAPHQSPTLMGEGPWGSLLAVEGSARHDGWTGALMAQFCEVLAETGIVVDACLAVGKSSNTAYANRRRDPLFAGMWEAALGIARNRLADALLARSIEGSVEYYYRDGELIGEKRHIDNRLGLAVLRRLDRLMETGSPLPFYAQSNPVRTEPFHSGQRRSAPVHPERSRGAPSLDWDQMIGALRTREPGAMTVALAAFKSHETHETHDPPNPPTPEDDSAAEDDEIEDVRDRVWQDDELWWTDFPPPAGFTDIERGNWGSYGYKRVCTDEEAALLDAVYTLDQAEERAAEDAERIAYFADVAAELAEAANDTAP